MIAKIQFVPKEGDHCYAGSKAPRDATAIAERLGFRRFYVKRTLPPVAWLSGLYWVLWMVKSIGYLLCIPYRACVFIQCTELMFTGRFSLRMMKFMRKLKRASFITLVHDVDALRGRGYQGCCNILDPRLRQFVQMSDVLIVHNAAMRKWFEAQGVPSSRLVELGIFDYLSTAFVDTPRMLTNEVIVAGCLAHSKAAYLPQLKTIPDVRWNLFGPEYDQSAAAGENVTYFGCHTPEELPRYLKGSFGLVWDGDSVETCGGTFGEYLRYNNPHKISLYLASGLPVVIWRKAALAEFVESNRLGLCVDSLRDLPAAISALDADAYDQMCQNVKRVAAKLRAGHFLEVAIKSAVTFAHLHIRMRGFAFHV